MRVSWSDSVASFRGYGNKAYGLALLASADFAVPDFIALDEHDIDSPCNGIEKILKDHFGSTARFSVRSSSSSEDSQDVSFAGQFKTFLNVGIDDVVSRASDVFASAHNVSASSYADSKSSDIGKMNVVVQEMVDADYAGVLFTRNPLGILSEGSISLCRGLGEGVVSDKADVLSYRFDYEEGRLYREEPKHEGGANEFPSSLDTIALSLFDARNKIESTFSHIGMDVEFALHDDTLFFLQARAITTIGSLEHAAVLDNGNIIESYPGSVSPLSGDFISLVYSEIFTSLMAYLSKDRSFAKKHSDVFNNMVSCFNGRMYYRVDSWLFVLAQLPFSKRIIPIWHEMLGIEPLPGFCTAGSAGKTQKARIALSCVRAFFSVNNEMDNLKNVFENIERTYRKRMASDPSYDELQNLFYELLDMTMSKWYWTLANDLYLFVGTWAYRKKLIRHGLTEAQAREALTVPSSIESMKPLESVLRLSALYKKEGRSASFEQEVSEHIRLYGDRCVGELKLENKTYSEDRDMLIDTIASMSVEEMTEATRFHKAASMPLEHSFSCKMFTKGTASREFSRLNRSRLFGFVRNIFLKMGEKLSETGQIENEEDIWFLRLDEALNPGNAVFSERVSERKRTYGKYADKAFPHRIVFESEECMTLWRPMDDALETEDRNEEGAILSGISAAAGKTVAPIVKATPESIASLDTAGKIIVAESTDPGWVFAISRSKGIIAERGSLLSHTSIISRELGIPSLVGATGAMAMFENGDIVELDCDKGTAVRIEKRQHVAC